MKLRQWIYVIQGSTGEYADRVEWLVRAFNDQEEATMFCNMLNERLEELKVSTRCALVEIDNNAYDNELCKEAIKLLKKHDPDIRIDYTGTRYEIVKVPMYKMV